MPEIFSFSEILEYLKKTPESRAKRLGWNGPDQFISIQWPDEHSANTLPYLWIKIQQGGRVPWLASQTDLLAEDWIKV